MKNILIVAGIVIVFVGGFLVGRQTEQKSQEAICVARIAEAKENEDSACNVLLNTKAAQLDRLTYTFEALQARCGK